MPLSQVSGEQASRLNDWLYLIILLQELVTQTSHHPIRLP